MAQTVTAEPKSKLRTALKILGSLLLVIALAIGGFMGWAHMEANKRHERAWDVNAFVPEVTIPTDAASIARGEHLSQAVFGCSECHGEDLGGKVVFSEGPVATIRAPNLTRGRGGRGGSLTPQDWIRAITHGVGRDRKSLWLMPVEDYQDVSVADLGAVVAWGMSRPPVDRDLGPAMTLGPVGAMLVATGEAKLLVAERIPHARRQWRETSPSGRTLEHGEYIAQICRGCHGANLGGQPMHNGPPGTPDAPNLRRGGVFGLYTEEELATVFTTGRGKGARELHEMMPWRTFTRMTAEERGALFDYLHSLE